MMGPHLTRFGKTYFRLLIGCSLVMLSFSQSARGDEAASPVASSSASTQRLSVIRDLNVDGQSYQIKVEAYINQHKTHEYAYSLIEKHRFTNTSFVFLYARDLNFDKKPDLWFLIDKTGVAKNFHRESRDPLGLDVVQDLIHDSHIHNRSLFKVGFDNLVLLASFGFSMMKTYAEKLNQREMDLIELEYYADEMYARDPHNPELPVLYRHISDAWTEFSADINKYVWRGRVVAFADPFVWVASGRITELFVINVGRGIHYAGQAFANTMAGKALFSFFEQSAEHLGQRLAVFSAKYAPKSQFFQASASPSLAAGKRLVAHIQSLSPKDRVSAWIEEMHGRGGLSHKLATTLTNTHHGAKLVGNKIADTTAFQASMGAGREIAYIAWVQTLQMAIETAARGYFNSDPIIMSRKIVSDDDLMQNFWYMTLETGQQAGVSNVTPEVGKRLRLCGAISMLNSRALSIMIKGESDITRTALDTGWEMVVGNGQTQLDFWSMKMAAQLAERAHVPGLRLVGFAIVTLDQGTGYYLYNRVTTKYEESKAKKDKSEPQVELRPIYTKE